MRALTLAACVGLFLAMLAPIAPALGDETAQQHRLPKKFQAVDTSRLMGSPDPLPLEAKKVYANLKFNRPVEFTHAGDNSRRMFVVEQKGKIHVFDNRRPDVDKTTLFLDIEDIVLSKGNEEGLLGLAFHPKYRENGQFFVYYCAKPRLNVLARYQVTADDPNRADPKSEQRLLEIKDPYENHNGGSIRFGHDGYLYVGLGDGGSRDDPHGHAQDLSTLLGSILRLDVDRKDEGLEYAIPKDNPFVGRRNAQGEIWAYGLRNVWRLAVDRKTGDLWAADVGQDRFEEVNLIQRGGNYGWNLREGMHDFYPDTPTKRSELIDPLVEYFRHDGGSITGGLVYRGKKLKDFAGAYFYGDYISGNVWALQLDDHKKVKSNRVVAKTGLGITAFGEDQDGEMFLCADDGYLYQLRDAEWDDRKDGDAFPRKLSETGLFASVKENVPAPGLIPYEVNMPFWSDYAVKDRYIALPEKGTVKFDERKKWDFPVGTVFVKTFWMHTNRKKLSDPQRLETRLFVRAPSGWAGYTYVYDDDQSEAYLLDGWLTKSVKVTTENAELDQQYPIPARNDCFACHTKAEGFVLGMTTRQMNRTLAYRGERVNQIALLDRLGVFENEIGSSVDQLEAFPDWGFGNFDRNDDDAEQNSLEPAKGDSATLARAWLEVNCAVCHRPEGIAPRQRDLRFHASLKEMNVVGVTPKHGQMSGPRGQVVKPGDPHESELVRRAMHRGGLGQMPPLSTRYVDERGMEVLRKWIAELEPDQGK